jgi:hypothetical protein
MLTTFLTIIAMFAVGFTLGWASNGTAAGIMLQFRLRNAFKEHSPEEIEERRLAKQWRDERDRMDRLPTQERSTDEDF